MNEWCMNSAYNTVLCTVCTLWQCLFIHGSFLDCKGEGALSKSQLKVQWLGLPLPSSGTSYIDCVGPTAVLEDWCVQCVR